MKWGRRKPPSPSLSHSSSVSSIFPLSWISKFKQISGISECKPTKAKGGMGSGSVPTPTSWKDGRFYAGDEDSYWRLSFGDENFERQRSRGGLQSVQYVSDDELEEFTFPSCQNCQRDADDVTERQEAWKFNQTVSNIRKLRELPCSEDSRNGENIDFKVPRRKSQKDRKWRKTNGGNMEEKMSEFERQSDRAEDIQTIPEEKDIYELLLVKITDETKRDCPKRAYSSSKKHGYNSYANSSNLNLRTGGEHSMPEALNLDGDGLSEGRLNSEWKKLEGMKIKDLMAKSETQRKSIYFSRELQRRTKQSSKVKAYSPRTAYRLECKIKAIEDMKRAKKKMDKKMKEKPLRERTEFDSFAFVKSSFDPHGDFRNSMIEMITTKGIQKAEELEELLACYLTLNVDEYHDIIIKVFRQVWFELNQDYLAPEFQS